MERAGRPSGVCGRGRVGDQRRGRGRAECRGVALTARLAVSGLRPRCLIVARYRSPPGSVVLRADSGRRAGRRQRPRRGAGGGLSSSRGGAATAKRDAVQERSARQMWRAPFLLRGVPAAGWPGRFIKQALRRSTKSWPGPLIRGGFKCRTSSSATHAGCSLVRGSTDPRPRPSASPVCCVRSGHRRRRWATTAPGQPKHRRRPTPDPVLLAARFRSTRCRSMTPSRTAYTLRPDPPPRYRPARTEQADGLANRSRLRSTSRPPPARLANRNRRPTMPAPRAMPRRSWRRLRRYSARTGPVACSAAGSVDPDPDGRGSGLAAEGHQRLVAQGSIGAGVRPR